MTLNRNTLTIPVTRAYVEELRAASQENGQAESSLTTHGTPETITRHRQRRLDLGERANVLVDVFGGGDYRQPDEPALHGVQQSFGS